MEEAKIQLSDAEMALVLDADVILTKNRIMAKAKTLLEGLQAHMQDAPGRAGPLFATGPKISRGENYEGLPYLVLDYPRIFGQEHQFAIRTFFWWGHFFSSTLQLSGDPYRQYAPRLIAAYEALVQHQYFVQVGTDAWAHHFGPDNYQPMGYFKKNDFEAHCRQRHQIKIAARWPLEGWPHAANNLWESWRFLLGVCGV